MGLAEAHEVLTVIVGVFLRLPISCQVLDERGGHIELVLKSFAVARHSQHKLWIFVALVSS